MALSDQTLYCRDCNQEFVFTVGEQEFYASHNLTNAPTRCPSCRAARKAQSSGGYSSGRSGGSREPRQMYTAICSNCGNEAQVPFSHVVTSLCIAAIVISRRGLAEVVTVDRAGNHYE